MLSAKISRELKKITEYQLRQLVRLGGCLGIHIALSNPSIDQVRILAQDYCVAIVSLSFELDIEQDEIRNPG